MYKSTDGGKNWTHIGLDETHIITWILVDPINPDVVYVAALGHLFAPNPDRGVFKTTDGGQTWKKILFVDDSTGAYSLTMDPANPSVVYASMWQMSRSHWTFSSGGPGSGIYKTTDGGANWTNITHNTGLPTGIFGKVGLAVAPSSPNTVYALIQATYKDQAGGLFRSDDAGQSWTLVNNSMDITQRAFYYGNVFVDPKDANTIYLPNVGVYVSHDGGKTLTPLRPPHGDNHVLWINPDNPQIFIEGNDGGAAVTLNGGRDFSSEDNQPTGQFYHANLDEQFPFHIYGAQQDRSSVDGAERRARRVHSAGLDERPGRRDELGGAHAGTALDHLRQRVLQHGVARGQPDRARHQREPVAGLQVRARGIARSNTATAGTTIPSCSRRTIRTSC